MFRLCGGCASSERRSMVLSGLALGGDNVTHVIVDKGLAFQEVLKHLCLETFPVSLGHGVFTCPTY